MFAETIDIDGVRVGENYPVYIIAEAGISHFGSEEKAYKLVDLAHEAGANAVKFQVFNVDEMISKSSPEWKERLGPRQLPYEAFERIQTYCNKCGITFFATAHDELSLEFLEVLNVPVYKIGSGEVGNWPYFKRIAKIGKPVIFSTGMYQQEQIGEALSVIRAEGNSEIAVLHCVTSYPTDPHDVSLKNIELIRNNYNVITGYSDHTAGYHIPLAAVALGARIIEKHITLDFDIPNAQDWKVSCGPHDLKRFVDETRDIEAALTLRSTGPTDTEKKSLIWASKSVVAKRSVAAGSKLSVDDLTTKRPGTGIPPSKIDEIVGKYCTVDLDKDDEIKWEYLSE